MPSPRDDLLRLAAQNTRFLDRLDRETIKAIADAYEAARLELIGTITERWNALYTGTASGEQELRMRELARDRDLLAQIEARLKVLRDLVGRITDSAWKRALDGGERVSEEELDILLSGLEPGRFDFSFSMVDYTAVEVGLEIALQKLLQAQDQTALVLIGELRVAMLRGESFDDMVKRMLARDASVFARGKISAALGARRNVITANNGGRQMVYEYWAPQIPGLGKQAVAAIGQNTTDCCLRVHGQVQPVNGLYRLEGEPRFADRLAYPAFHWNCRTSSVAYHEDFERGAKIKTSDMVDAAQAELQARTETGERVEIHPASATSRR